MIPLLLRVPLAWVCLQVMSTMLTYGQLADAVATFVTFTMALSPPEENKS